MATPRNDAPAAQARIDAPAAQARSVRPLLAAARSKRGGGDQEVEAPGKRPRRGAAIRAHQAWTLDHSTASLVFEPLEGGACEAAIIWLHGLDDTPEPWASRLAAERRRRPRWKWIHLRAQHAQDALTCQCPSSIRASFPGAPSGSGRFDAPGEETGPFVRPATASGASSQLPPSR